MRRGLASMYDRLTSETRFRLVIDALAREDEREAERLSNTCPREAYRINAPAFTKRLRASQLIVSCICLELTEALGMLRTIEAYREVVERYKGALCLST